MSDTITGEQDIIELIRERYGAPVGLVSENVTVHGDGHSKVRIDTPLNKEQEVIDLLRNRNCRITKRCKRTAGDTDVALQVMVGDSDSKDVYATNFKEEEIYSGEPFRTI